MKTTAAKFCRCIKTVRKTIKARPGSTAEQGAIAVCVKSVLQTRGRTMKKFSCGKKPRLATQRMRGGVRPSPWIVFKNTVLAATDAMRKRPENRDAYAHELLGRLNQLGELPAVTPETRRYYDAAMAASADFPEVQNFIRPLEQGSAWVRRGPLVQLRRRLREAEVRQ